MSVDPKDSPAQCFAAVPTEILIHGNKMDVRSRRCPERIALGKALCPAHLEMLDATARSALAQCERFDVARGLAVYGQEWKRQAEAACKAVFRLLVEAKLAERKASRG